MKKEKKKVQEILSFSKADPGLIITADIDLFRELKLRLLNGSHTFSCGLAFLAGFNTVKEAVDKVAADVSIIFVPPAFAADAIMEAAEAGIKVIICITEGIPVKDMVLVKEYLKGRECRLIGPNCPGVISAEEAKVGIMPGFVFKKGTVGIVSKSGTLTYEASDQTVKAGLGITTAIGIGGDPIIGTTTKQAVELLMNDPETHGIIMIGEIGGNLEADAARWIKADGAVT
jgi:succinyl-CoA synthetase alpha subunit